MGTIPEPLNRASVLSDFNQFIPPFPTDLEQAPLVVISHAKLSARDPVEIERLWDACRSLGFFYYDLREVEGTPSGRAFLEAADEMFEFMPIAFGVPLGEKLECRMEKNGAAMFGYKVKGISVVDKKGTPDNMEHYFLGSRDILNLSPPDPVTGAPFEGRLYPRVIVDAFPGPIRNFNNVGFETVQLLLSILSEKLGISGDILTRLHQQSNNNATNVRFLVAPPRTKDDPDAEAPSFMPHTDWGSITVLFNIIGGLQVLVPAGLDSVNPSEGWRWVKPLPGHAVINLGDAMVKFSNSILRSNIHRVMTPPGEQAKTTRYSLAYFMRPENDAPMCALEGTEIPPEKTESDAKPVMYLEWMLRRAYSGLKKKDYSDEDWKQAGGTEWKRD